MQDAWPYLTCQCALIIFAELKELNGLCHDGISSLSILQTHSFVINKFVFQALYLKLQEREMNF